MRTLATIIFVLGISGIEKSTVQEDVHLAGAIDAAIGIPPQQISISDHYGDPDGFMKYIIKKPPVHA